MHCSVDGAVGAGAFVDAFGAGLAATRSEDGDDRGADRAGGLRDGHAFPDRAEATGGMARAVGALGLVAERGIERNGIGGSAGVRDLSRVGADADYRRAVLSGGPRGGGAGGDERAGGAGAGARAGGAGEGSAAW